MELSGKVCLVTGASRGIGRATAAALVERGAVVAAAATTTEALGDLGAASVHAADLGDPADALRLVDAVTAEHGRVDVLICNAAVRVDGRVDELDLEAADRAFQVNVLSPLAMAGAVVPAMRERGEGAVVTLLAPMVSGGRKGMGAYAASKAALASLTATLRQEAGSGVLVLGFDPGWVRTDLAPDGKEEPGPVAGRLVGHLETTSRSPREPVS
jgi:NAD(P)-dependent dehydrogenase (short-subunit alcohol dehydrogenase family)